MAQANPLLEQLKDIHLPGGANDVSIWPPAPGWWILGFTLLALLFWLVTKWIKKRQYAAMSRYALKELKIMMNQNPPNSLSSVSRLLKRAALAYYPAPEVASLSGKKWLAFLNQTGKTNFFTSQAGEILAYGQYQAPQQIPKTHLEALFKASEKWLKILPENAMKNSASMRKAGSQKNV